MQSISIFNRPFCYFNHTFAALIGHFVTSAAQLSLLTAHFVTLYIDFSPTFFLFYWMFCHFSYTVAILTAHFPILTLHVACSTFGFFPWTFCQLQGGFLVGSMMRALNVFAVAAAGGGALRQVKGGQDGLRSDWGATQKPGPETRKSITHPKFMGRQQRGGMIPVLAAALAEAPLRSLLII